MNLTGLFVKEIFLRNDVSQNLWNVGLYFRIYPVSVWQWNMRWH